MDEALARRLDERLQRLRTTEGQTVDGYARALKQVLTLGPPEVRVRAWDFAGALAGTPLGALMTELREAGRPRQAASLAHWAAADFLAIARRFLRLYNAGDPGVVRVLRQILFECDPADTIPYLYMPLLMIGHEILGDPRVDQLMAKGSSGPAWTGVLRDLAADPRTAAFLATRTQALRYYGGGTNTVLGLYDEHLAGAAVRETFELDAGFLGDLGGGVATSDVSRATGRTFTSLDIRSPDPVDGDPDHLPLRKWVDGRTRMLSREERAEYFVRQQAVPWIRWDVLARERFRPLLGDHASYGFVSTGFLTSTVQPLTDDGTLHDESTFDATTVLTLKRIIELVERGKDVSLFTVGRPSNRQHYFKTALLRWRNRELVASTFVPATLKPERTVEKRQAVLQFLLSAGSGGS